MNTATAEAKTELRTLTAREALSIIEASAGSLIWRILEEFEIGIDPINRQWFADERKGRKFELGATPKEAVEELLRLMGGAE